MQPEDAIALPTEIVFNKNPLLELKDQVKEIGKLEKYMDNTLEVDDIYEGIQEYKRYMDSTGEAIRPGLADSMRVLEEMYLQQQKK